MSLATYSDLKTAIATALDRDDLTDDVDDFIDLAEEMHKRSPELGGVRIREMMAREPITVNARQISLPTGFLEPISFRLLTNPVTVLQYINYHEMNRRRQETNDKPEYYTFGNEIEFDVNADSSYSGEIIFWKAETALSDSNTSNNILSRVPGAYLYGALVAATPHIMDDPRLPMWKTLYAESTTGANSQARKGRYAGPLRSRIAGSTP